MGSGSVGSGDKSELVELAGKVAAGTATEAEKAALGLLCAAGTGGCSLPHGDEVDMPNDPVWEKTR